MKHLMIEEDKSLCGDNAPVQTYREGVADCSACFRVLLAQLQAEAKQAKSDAQHELRQRLNAEAEAEEGDVGNVIDSTTGIYRMGYARGVEEAARVAQDEGNFWREQPGDHRAAMWQGCNAAADRIRALLPAPSAPSPTYSGPPLLAAAVRRGEIENAAAYPAPSTASGEAPADVAFDEHLDRCDHCRANPFDLCVVGVPLHIPRMAPPAPTGERCARCGGRGVPLRPPGHESICVECGGTGHTNPEEHE